MQSHDPIADLAAGFRPWSDDLADPQWREVREKISSDANWSARFDQHTNGDQQLRNSLHQLDIPVGLCDRLLLSVAQEAEVALPNNQSHLTKVPKSQTFSRRTWLMGTITTAASVAVVGGLSLWNMRNQPTEQAISREELAREVAQWLEAYQYLQTSKQWSTSWRSREVAARPISHIKTNPRRWHSVACPSDSAAVAYDLRGPGRSTAVLFVVRTSRAYQLPSLPVSGGNLSLSRNKFASAAWQTGNLLYVLVVDEDGVSLDDFLQPSRVA